MSWDKLEGIDSLILWVLSVVQSSYKKFIFIGNVINFLDFQISKFLECIILFEKDPNQIILIVNVDFNLLDIAESFVRVIEVYFCNKIFVMAYIYLFYVERLVKVPLLEVMFLPLTLLFRFSYLLEFLLHLKFLFNFLLFRNYRNYFLLIQTKKLRYKII